MPVAHEHGISHSSGQTQLFQNGNRIITGSSLSQPMVMRQFASLNVPTPSTAKPTSREITVSLDQVNDAEDKKKSRRMEVFLIIPLVLFSLCAIAASILVPILLIRNETTSSTYSSGSISSTITTTVNCVSPYALGLSGTCVNILIDINNCGAVGNVCPSNYTSCSAGQCSLVPGVQLANPSFVWTAAINGSIDDNFFPVTLPFNITLYNTTTDVVQVTTNGVICLGSCSTVFTETTLPAAPFSGATALAYWDDLYIYSGTSQGIYYGVQGSTPNRTLTFEFYMSHFGQSSQYYHYQILFFESFPGVVQYKYYSATDGGITCTIGVQASNTGPFIQYSFDIANSVHSNMSLTFDTNFGTYVNSTF